MKTKKQKTTLEKIVREARKSGVKVTVSLEDNKMPMRFPNDPEPVKLLIAESERCSALGNQWMTAEIPNQVAGELCLRNGWAYALAACWMRAKLRGDVK